MKVEVLENGKVMQTFNVSGDILDDSAPIDVRMITQNRPPGVEAEEYVLRSIVNGTANQIKLMQHQSGFIAYEDDQPNL